MKKILFFILVVSLSGCSISKKTAVKENVKLDTVENVDRSEKENTTQSSYTDAVKEVKTNVTDKTITRTTETEYSEPDSTGQQHITRERTTETLNDIAILNEENERIISEQSQTIERLTSDNSTLRTQLEASHRETTKTTTRPPIWTYVVAFITGAGLSLILRSWLKGIFKL